MFEFNVCLVEEDRNDRRTTSSLIGLEVDCLQVSWIMADARPIWLVQKDLLDVAVCQCVDI